MEDFRKQLTQLLVDEVSSSAKAAAQKAHREFIETPESAAACRLGLEKCADRIQKLLEDDAAGLPLFRKQRYQARYWKDRLQKMETASRKADG